MAKNSFADLREMGNVGCVCCVKKALVKPLFGVICVDRPLATPEALQYLFRVAR